MIISGAVTVVIAGINSEHTEVVELKQVALVWLRGRYMNLSDGLSGFSSLTFLEELHPGERLETSWHCCQQVQTNIVHLNCYYIFKCSFFQPSVATLGCALVILHHFSEFNA